MGYMQNTFVVCLPTGLLSCIFQVKCARDDRVFRKQYIRFVFDRRWTMCGELQQPRARGFRKLEAEGAC